MKALLKSLVEFNKQVKPIIKGANNPFHKSKYASLDTIQQTIRQPLIDNGLVITQSNVMSEGQLLVETRIWHSESGESMGSIFPIIVNKQSAQDYGSAVSYAKRYSLSGLLNLIIENEDDDGNKASSQPTIETIVEAVDNNLPWLNEKSESFDKVKKALEEGKATLADVRKKFKVSKKVSELLTKTN
jgi:hypothetical protein